MRHSDGSVRIWSKLYERMDPSRLVSKVQANSDADAGCPMCKYK